MTSEVAKNEEMIQKGQNQPNQVKAVLDKSDKQEISKKPIHKRLWINDDWYIPVDDEGKCAGPCAEGALGFVIQLQSAENPNYHMALKLPRLMGETHRENAYICDLMEKELRSVQEVFRGGGKPDGLLNAAVGGRSPTQGPISTERGIPEALAWDDAIIFVHYKKGQNPNFCLVKKDGRKIDHFPRSADCPVKSVEMFNSIKECAKNLATKRDWANSVFIDFGEVKTETEAESANQPAIFPIKYALENDPYGRIWYTCIPSIMYGWAPGTLQEAISLGLRGEKWDVRKHLLLVENMCRGLYALHSKGMLHADVRPANIVYQGDPTNPNSYSLSDYGSFAKTGARAPERFPQGGTVMGPVVGGERTSAFYAPERRSGHEQEIADTAVVYNPGDGTNLYIILGWRSNLIDSNTNKPDETVTKYVNPRPKSQKSDKDYSSTLLQKGDRIQVREYIFELVDDEWSVEDKQILVCSKKFWKIYHGRIVVNSTDRFKTLDWFPIPRIVKLLQWSASTDLYSLGALALYSVYRGIQHRAADAFTETSDSNSKEKGQDHYKSTAEASSKIEEDFRQMLTYLASPPYFDTIWPELEWLRREMEAQFQNEGLNAVEFANLPFRRHDEADRQLSDSIASQRTLREAVVYVVRRLTQTVPGARHLVAAFDYDLGPFIFYIHFVLCCLHRQSDMNIRKEWETWMEIKPFSIDRREQPSSDGAVFKALERLEEIKNNIVGDRLLSELRSNDKEIPEYNPEPDQTIRVQLTELREQVNKWEIESEQLSDQISSERQEMLQLIEAGLDKVNEKSGLIQLGSKRMDEIKGVLTKAKNLLEVNTQLNQVGSEKLGQESETSSSEEIVTNHQFNTNESDQ